MTVDLNFSRSNMEFAISQPKMVRLPRNKKQTYRLTSRAQCHHRVGPWPWPWPWIFKVKYRICYSSAKNGPIATKRKANISIKLWVSNVTIGFDLGHDIDLEFSRSNMECPISQPKVVRLPQNEKQTYRLNSRPQMWPMGLTLTFECWRSNVTLTFAHTHDLDYGFSWSNFEITVSRNGRADWHCTKGVAVGHSWPWPFGDQGQVCGSTR